jgi:hypothetical protein
LGVHLPCPSTMVVYRLGAASIVFFLDELHDLLSQNESITENEEQRHHKQRSRSSSSVHRLVLAARSCSCSCSCSCSYSYSYSYSVRQDGARARSLILQIVPFRSARCTGSIQVSDRVIDGDSGRIGDGNTAMPTSRSITSTSTASLSTSTMGIRQPVGQNDRDHPVAAKNTHHQESANPRFGCIAWLRRLFVTIAP